MTNHFRKTLRKSGLADINKQNEKITPSSNFIVRISVRSALIVLERELSEVRNG